MWTIRLYKESIESIDDNRIGEYIFDIEFKDICWDSDLLKPVFDEPSYMWDLWQEEKMIFLDMKDNTLGVGYCWGTSSVLEYVSGPALPIGDDPSTVDLSHYIYTPQPDDEHIALEGVVDDPAWLGIHYLRVKSTLGQFNPDADA